MTDWMTIIWRLFDIRDGKGYTEYLFRPDKSSSEVPPWRWTESMRRAREAWLRVLEE